MSTRKGRLSFPRWSRSLPYPAERLVDSSGDEFLGYAGRQIEVL